ncbi:MAG: c-type cytochrome [Cyclobacteriaceae bacterium]|jgi:mono/diheme cytochrome c family protein|tara:strand:- start:4263 stop:4637 length:375 start_codon:yes stop_codon:yes gene_type:complete
MKSMLIIFILMNITIIQEPWKAPAEANKLKNPVAGQENAIKQGKKIYATYCVICHGEKGKGDGAAGVALNPKPGNFTTSTFTTQSDGAIFWKITEGRAPMASYKASLTEEQRWQLVSYIRTLKK